MDFITPNYKGINRGHYSAGVVSNGLLYISGQLSINPDTRIVPEGSIREHVRLALQNVERVSREAGLHRNSIVQLRIYICDMNGWDETNDECKAFFGDHKPARIIVNVPQLHFGCKAEIEAVAEI